ncbi:MAG TPA: Tim44-like domain-containing protein [Burkholderiales bacterium]|nr:Tim44-like domain-containing protein [Burkholderiales bacterium]
MSDAGLNKFALLLVLGLLSVGLAAFDAHATKRLASGSSIGKRHNPARHQTYPLPARPVQPPASIPAPAEEPWFLAGVTAGGLLAALLTDASFDRIRFADVAMLALLLGAALFLFRVLRRKPVNETMQYAALGAETTPSLPARMFGGSARPSPYPIGFEVEPFLRNAKEGFFRLREAIATKDLDVVRDYTTPQAFEELSKQIAARGTQRPKTDILTLDAELLELAIDDHVANASVRFSGLNRGADNAPARPFYEIWNVQKFLNERNSVWLLAGISHVR